MEVINENFIEVKNLDDLDVKIEELNSLKKRISSAVQTKVRGEDEKTGIGAKLEDVRVLKRVEEVLEGIHSVLDERDGSKRIHRVREMEERYGQLDILTQIRALCEQIEINAGELRFMEADVALRGEIERLELGGEAGVLKSELSKVVEGIEGLRSHNPKYQADIDRLHQFFKQKLSEERIEAEAALLSVFQETTWLSVKSDSRDIPSKSLQKIKYEMSRLIALQKAYGAPVYPDTWWAFDVLLSPVVRRFMYHFNSSNKETNKISKPEWALEYIESFLSENIEYIDLVLGDIFEGSRIVSFEVISSMLKPLREKFIQSSMAISKSLEQFEEDHVNSEKSGRMLSHMIYELSVFDQRLKKIYRYNPYAFDLAAPPSKKWAGLTADVLLAGDEDERMALKWLNFEFELANKRFESEIMQPENAFTIDYDVEIPGAIKDVESDNWILKPTFAASNLIRLIENLTNHFKHIGIVKYQLKFVSRIQLKLIDKYSEAIRQNLRKYEELYNSKYTLGLIPGGLGGNTTSTEPLGLSNSLEGLNYLAEQYCSAKSVTDSLEQWSEELLFIQLWNAYTTASSQSDPTDVSIFESSLVKFRNLTDEILKKFSEFFKREIKTAFKSYVNSTQWDTAEPSSDLEPSNELAWLIDSVPAYTSQLHKCLGRLDCFVIFDSIVSIISAIFIEYVITNNHFSHTGRMQLKTDFDFIMSKIKDDLFLHENAEYTTANNKTYMKLESSIRFFTELDLENTKNRKFDYNSVEQLRIGFHDQLSALKNHEVIDLLRRII